jgi:haloalkane dehalogenase
MTSPSSISAHDPYPRRRATVHGAQMAYVDVGRGDPVIFVHGNPTSSRLWRNVIPHVEPHGRCLAPDLIGMGDSDTNPEGSYRLADHARFFDGWVEGAGIDGKVTLVLHDWGSIIGFDWARRHPERVRAVVYMEAVVRPLTWDEWPATTRELLRQLRQPGAEALAWENMAIVAGFLAMGTRRPLSADELAAYSKPYLVPGERRLPPITFVREVPIGGAPEDVCQLVAAYADWLAQTPVPKLFINAEPGLNLVGAQRDFCRRWPAQQEVTVAGTHFLPEDCPAEIGAHIARFLGSLT